MARDAVSAVRWTDQELAILGLTRLPRIRKSVTCDECDEVTPAGVCPECGTFLCTDCAFMHDCRDDEDEDEDEGSFDPEQEQMMLARWSANVAAYNAAVVAQKGGGDGQRG